MHEYSIVSSLLDRVEREAHSRQARSVQKIHLRIGALAGVEVDLLETAFETFRERTVCDRAILDIQNVPAEWACPRCGDLIPPGRALRCPACDLPAALLRGDEIVLQRIEMEVGDV